MPYLDQFLQAIVAEGASDLHIGEGQPPKMRRHGDVMAMRPEPVPRDEAVLMLSEISGPANWEIFDERGDLDFAYEMDAASRFRCNFLKQANGYGAVFRLIPTKIATLEELGIPPVVKEFGHLRGGLVLVTGPTGSGKSTTLAALIDYINEQLCATHRDDRRTDRVRAQQQTEHHHAARSAGQFPHRSRKRSESGVARRCRYRARRRDARSRNHFAGANRGGDGPARLRNAAHEQRAQDRRSHGRCFSRESTAAGAHNARQFAARGAGAIAPEKGRRLGTYRG